MNLKQYEIKNTKWRLTMLEVMRKHGCLLSAEEIFHKCRGTHLDFATVYRNLKLFESKYLIRKSNLGDGIDRFELVSNDDYHHHLICVQCHKIEKLSDCSLKGLETVARKSGFTHISHNLEMFGNCGRCLRVRQSDSESRPKSYANRPDDDSTPDSNLSTGFHWIRGKTREIRRIEHGRI